MGTTTPKVSLRKNRPFRRLHNVSFAIFLLATLFIILAPFPKQLSLSKLSLRHVRFIPSRLLPSSQPTLPPNASQSDIINQLNSDRSLPRRHYIYSHATLTKSSQTYSTTLTTSSPTTTATTATAAATETSITSSASISKLTAGGSTSTDQKIEIPNDTASLSHAEIEIRKLLANRSYLQSNPRTNHTYILFRAIGNDLPPRHALGQSYSNVKFILDHEQQLPDLDVRWYVNRIFDDDERLRILQLLVQHNQFFFVNEFNLTDYARADFRLKEYFGHRDVLRSNVSMTGLSLTDFKFARAWDMIFESKNHYIVHNNQARNAMVSLGREAGATYILPWDGNCFLNAKAWANITSSISNIVHNVTKHENVSSNYFYVPMARMKNDSGNDWLKRPDYAPYSMPDEPQIIFHRLANATFDENKPYGYRPKVDFLWRLRIPEFQFRDRKGRIMNKTMAWKHVTDIPGFDSVRPVGWTARLFSGSLTLEGADANTAIARGWSRSDGVEYLAARASLRYAERHLNYSRRSTLFLYDRNRLQHVSQANRSFSALLDLAQTSPPDNHTAVGDLAKHAIAVGIVEHAGQSSSFRNATEQRIIQWFSEVNPELILMEDNVSTLLHTCVLLDAARLLGMTRRDEVKVITKWAEEMSDLISVSIQNVENDTDTSHVTLRKKWLPLYYSQSRDAVLFEAAAACIAAATRPGEKTDRFHMTLRHTSLARLRMHAMFLLDTQARETYMTREGVRGLVPWFLLAFIGERIGVDIWNHMPPVDKKILSDEPRIPFLVSGISHTLLEAEVLDDPRHAKVVAWVRAIARRKFNRNMTSEARVSAIEEIADNNVLEKTKSEDIDKAIPPFFELGI